MPTYRITAPDGRTAIIEAPEGVSEQEAIEFAQENWAGWVDGGRYAMRPEADVATDEDEELPGKVDRSKTPLGRQEAAEAAFEEARKAWRQATGGALKPGQTEPQAVAEWSKTVDPATTRAKAEIEQTRETGEVPYGESVAYGLSKGLAGVGGFMLGGPAGATAAEGATRLAALTYNLQRAIDAGAITEEQAAEKLTELMIKDTGVDAAFNFGIPILGQLVKNIPGVRGLAEKAGRKIGALAQRAGARATAGVEGELVPRGVVGDADEMAEMMFQARRAAPKAAQAARVLESRRALAQTPEQREAVTALTRRAGGVVPTPGQVTGDAPLGETSARIAHPSVFTRAEKQLATASEEMRQQFLYPGAQPSAQRLGEQIVKTAEATERAVKTRLAPVFEEARQAGVMVDARGIVSQIDDVLARHAKVPGGLELKPGEVAKLQQIADNLRVETPGGVAIRKLDAESALDFVSARKADARAITQEGAPSNQYQKILGELIDTADQAYRKAIAGQGDLAARLIGARNDYREVMSTVYDDAVKAALKRNPEDVGRLFWQSGNVSEIQQLQKLTEIAKKEGVMSANEVRKLHGDMARGFLQEAVRSPEAAAKWSETLAADPLKRRTWETITGTSGGEQLKSGMRILEEASKIAMRNNAVLGDAAGIGAIPLARAARGGLGVSYVTGMFHPGIAAVGITLDGATRAMATAYTQGNRGIIRDLARVLRASGAGTPAAVQATKEALPRIAQWAQENNIELFEYEPLPGEQ